MPSKKVAAAKVTMENENNQKRIQKKQDEENQQPVDMETASPKKATNDAKKTANNKTGRSQKKNTAETPQHEASGLTERINKNFEMDNKSTDEAHEKEKSPRKNVSTSTTPKNVKSTEGKQTSKTVEIRTGKRQSAKTASKQDQSNEEESANEKMTTTPKGSAKGRAIAQKKKKVEEEQKDADTGKDNRVENVDQSPSKKPKDGKSARKQGQKSKANIQEVEIEHEQNVIENDTKKKATTNKKAKGSGSTKKQVEIAEKTENEAIRVNIEPKLPEDNEGDGTTKKGPRKRAAPTPDHKTGLGSAKKKTQNDGPSDDRTNVKKEVEDEASTGKQQKKGRSADKASALANKANNRGGKKIKGT